MIAKGIQYQVRRNLRMLMFITMVIMIAVAGIVAINTWVNKMTGTPSDISVSFVGFLSFTWIGTGAQMSPQFFKWSNTVGLTRVNQFVVELCSIMIVVTLVLFGQFVLTLIFKEGITIQNVTLEFGRLGHTQGEVIVTLLGNVLSGTSLYLAGSIMGMFVDKFSKNIGLFILMGVAAFVTIIIPIVLSVAISYFTFQQNNVWLVLATKVWDYLSEVPGYVMQAVFYTSELGIYWLMYRKHVSRRGKS